MFFWRKQYNYTQVNIAELLQISERTYRNYEQNEISPPINILITLADLYGISIDELIGRQGHK